MTISISWSRRRERQTDTHFIITNIIKSMSLVVVFVWKYFVCTFPNILIKIGYLDESYHCGSSLRQQAHLRQAQQKGRAARPRAQGRARIGRCFASWRETIFADFGAL